MPGLKKSNEYAKAFGQLYDKTPKSVFAAVANSLLTLYSDGNPNQLIDDFLAEWETLHVNGIVPQKPPQS
jgi:hypothetical protein